MTYDTAVYLHKRMAIFIIVQAVLTVVSMCAVFVIPEAEPFKPCLFAFVVGITCCACLMEYAERVRSSLLFERVFTQTLRQMRNVRTTDR